MLSDIINSGSTWASQAGTVTEWEKAVTGTPSQVDQCAAIMRTYIGFFDDGSMSVQPIKALFGVHGEPPMVAVQLGDCTVLLDAVTGKMSGPYEKEEPLNASGLLQAHPAAYAIGTGIQ
jgi:hypothetical protein